jgi:hypothetical protein
MSQAIKSPLASEQTLPADPYPDYRPVYGWLFQAWLIMFMAVISLSLVIYLLTFIP